MFHTFEAATAAHTQSGEHGVNPGAKAAKRRISTVQACKSCRARKIRCNGERPCESCQWYRKADTCFYTEPRRRQIQSRKSIENAMATLQQYRGILQKLFPHIHPDNLTDLPRETLIELIAKSTPASITSAVTPRLDEMTPPSNPDAGSLEQFQPMPEESPGRSDHSHKVVPGVTDDVNALSLSVEHSFSYLGISSVMAILRVIIWLNPDCQTHFKTPSRSSVGSREQTPPPLSDDVASTHQPEESPDAVSSAWDEIPLINAYFNYVHTFIPIIDEQSFRDTYMAGGRSDSRWLLLLNTVLAMGSIASGSADDTSHKTYYARAKSRLTIDTLGQPHLEVVQALAILGGFYLHYLQQPIIANALMGATLRMATTLGLHREYSRGSRSFPTKDQGSSSVEMRRRVWWCVFNLDAWASSTLGRPSMGRYGFAITVQQPQAPIVSQRTFSSHSPTSGQASAAQLVTLLQENIRFCIISTRMEDALAVSPLIPANDLALLDSSFVEWFNNSSCQAKNLQTHSSESPGITVTRHVMRWRYLTARIILHRPVFLWYAIRRMPFAKLSDEKKHAVTVCRDCTAELVQDIASTWSTPKRCQMSGWNATWFLYQAVMVPLLSLFSDGDDETVAEQSRRQVEIALMTLTELRSWSPTAKRSCEVVQRIYEASKRWTSEDGTSAAVLTVPQLQQGQPHCNGTAPTSASIEFSNPNIDQSFTHNVLYHPLSNEGHNNSAFGPGMDANIHQLSPNEVNMDNMFESLIWSTGWNHLDNPFEPIDTNYSAWPTGITFDQGLGPPLPEPGMGNAGMGEENAGYDDASGCG